MIPLTIILSRKNSTMDQEPDALAPAFTSSTIMKSPPVTAVKIDDSFWSKRMQVNRETTLNIQYEQCKTTGRVDAFKLDWKPGDTKPHYFWDSDIAKWIEAVSYSIASHPDAELDALLDDVIELIIRAQQPDGYVNIYFTAVEPENRWKNLRDHHELYCAGHLMEAAAAHYDATGKRTLLDVMSRYTDYIAQVFGTGTEQIPGYCGHEEIELALIKLYRATGESKYLKLSQYFIDQRGQQPHYFDTEARARGEEPSQFHFSSYEYNQSHLAVRDQTQVVGHAVRGMYLYAAMADLAGELGDSTLLRACERIWNHLTTHQMYITGGIGSSNKNEGYTFDYDLPNETAYAETCASIGLVFWAQRLLQLDCDSRYSDVMERALYNGVISGVSLDGTKFFYENPLASVGDHHRKEWFGCACCPPNLARIVASLGTYVYSSSADTIAIHLYVEGNADLNIGDSPVKVLQKTGMPWHGDIKITFEIGQPTQFKLKLRIPSWAETHTLKINGEVVDAVVERGYLTMDRVWTSTDSVTLELPINVNRVYANPLVRMNNGRVALQRGPLVYCMEEIDNGANLDSLSLKATEQFAEHFDEHLLDGVVVVEGAARLPNLETWGDKLYRTEPPTSHPVQFTAIPYFAWDNRVAGRMSVWIREES